MMNLRKLRNMVWCEEAGWVDYDEFVQHHKIKEDFTLQILWRTQEAKNLEHQLAVAKSFLKHLAFCPRCGEDFSTCREGKPIRDWLRDSSEPAQSKPVLFYEDTEPA